jgi:L-rhamnose isomerase / sugar isomerase
VRELVEHGGGAMPDVRYMIDASHNLKDPIEDLVQATDQIQCTIAQALLVDRSALHDAQDANDPALAEELLHDAFRSDVRPIVAEARRRNHAALTPLSTFRRTGYRAAVTITRGDDAISTGL